MPRYCVVLPLVPLAVGDAIDRRAWAPHVTLVGTFVAPDADAATAVLQRSAARVPPIGFVVGEEAWFGPDRSILVDLVEGPLLPSLHAQLLDGLEAAVDGMELIDPHHTRDGYRAHRTVTAGARPTRGDVLEATTVALVELDPPGRRGIAAVLGIWPLGGAVRSTTAGRIHDSRNRWPFPSC